MPKIAAGGRPRAGIPKEVRLKARRRVSSSAVLSTVYNVTCHSMTARSGLEDTHAYIEANRHTGIINPPSPCLRIELRPFPHLSVMSPPAEEPANSPVVHMCTGNVVIQRTSGWPQIPQYGTKASTITSTINKVYCLVASLLLLSDTDSRCCRFSKPCFRGALTQQQATPRHPDILTPLILTIYRIPHRST